MLPNTAFIPTLKILQQPRNSIQQIIMKHMLFVWICATDGNTGVFKAEKQCVLPWNSQTIQLVNLTVFSIVNKSIKSKIGMPSLGIPSTLQHISRVPFHPNSCWSFLLDAWNFSLTHTHRFWLFTFHTWAFAKIIMSVPHSPFPFLLCYKTSLIIKCCIKYHPPYVDLSLCLPGS